ncbi:MAG: phytoene/squalene synthase family protein [Planctomycetia bacterium]|nr:phytoene/squalene synthase family protein [Planctomycetia bacterium]
MRKKRSSKSGRKSSSPLFLPHVALSYEQCREIVQDSRSSFVRAMTTLPPLQRRAMEAVYAFMRCADDLADSDLPVETRREQLQDFRRDFLKSQTNGSSSAFINFYQHVNGIFPAVTDAIARFQIPAVYFDAVLEGVTSDLETYHYATYEALEDYCYHVASAVGLICLPIWGIPAEEVAPEADTPIKRAAIACGKALQFTNILRDVREDWERGRIYLPLEEASYETMSRAVENQDFRFLRPRLERFLEKTKQFYQESTTLTAQIPPRYQKNLRLMVDAYAMLFSKIRRNPVVVLRRRIRLSWLEKVWLSLFA